jgi:beta-xylosidase
MAGNDKSIVMESAQKDSPEEIESIPFTGKAVYLRIDCDFKNRADTASFAYSLDGRKWTAIGKPLKMAYTLPHFMGYRFGLFNFAAKTAGGSADFDWFRISDKLQPK